MTVDGSLSYLDILLQKTLLYKTFNRIIYLRSIEEGLTPTWLKLQKRPAFIPILEDFSIRNKILSDVRES